MPSNDEPVIVAPPALVTLPVWVAPSSNWMQSIVPVLT